MYHYCYYYFDITSCTIIYIWHKDSKKSLQLCFKRLLIYGIKLKFYKIKIIIIQYYKRFKKSPTNSFMFIFSIDFFINLFLQTFPISFINIKWYFEKIFSYEFSQWNDFKRKIVWIHDRKKVMMIFTTSLLYFFNCLLPITIKNGETTRRGNWCFENKKQSHGVDDGEDGWIENFF